MRYGWWSGAILLAMPAMAQARDYCPERPGLGTPACTLDAGRVSIETSLADWTLERDADGRTDTLLLGDMVARIGLGARIEAQLGWTPFGYVRARDKASGLVSRASRVGDASVALKWNVAHPDGSGFSAALQPYALLPVGRRPVGAGDWGAGLRIPLSYEVSETFSLQATPQMEAAVDSDGHGRHLAYGGVVGLGVAISKAVSATLEGQWTRDRDPDERTTQTVAGLSVGWMVNDDLQLDAGANAGLSRFSPDLQFYAGISRRF